MRVEALPSSEGLKFPRHWFPACHAEDSKKGRNLSLASAQSLVLVLDQFEDLFIRFPQIAQLTPAKLLDLASRMREPEPSFDDLPEEAASGIKTAACLIALLNDPGTPVNVVLSLREDFLSRLDCFKGLIPGLFDSTLRIQFLDEAGVRKVIGESLRRWTEDHQGKFEAEPGLVDAIVGDAGLKVRQLVRAGVDSRYETPFLQLSLEQIWIVDALHGDPDWICDPAGALLTEDTFTTLGNSQGVRSTFVDKSLADRVGSSNEQRWLIEACRFLVSRSQKFPWIASELVREIEEPLTQDNIEPPSTAEMVELLSRFTEVRLITQLPFDDQRDPDDGRFEVAHDSLAADVYRWRVEQLSALSSKRVHDQRVKELMQQQGDERAADREKARKVQNRILGFAAVVALGLAGWALSNAHRANKETKRANFEASEAIEAREDAEIAKAAAEAAAESERNARAETERKVDELAATAEELESKLQESEQVSAKLTEQLDEANRARANFEAIAADQAKVLSDIQDVLRDSESTLTADQERKLRDSEERVIATKDLANNGTKQVETLAKTSSDLIAQTSRAPEDVVADPKAPTLVKSLAASNDAITAIAFSKDGRLASAGLDNWVRIWSAEGEQLTEFQGSSSNGVNCIAFSPLAEPNQLVAGSSGSTVRVRDLVAETTRAYEGHKDAITSVCYHPNGSRILSASNDQTVQIWDAGNLKQWRTASLDAMVTSASFDPFGRRVIASTSGNRSIIWTPESDGIPIELSTGGSVPSGVFSPDGLLAATAGADDGTIAVWNVETGAKVYSLKGHEGRVFQVAFHPREGKIATASGDQTIRVWDSATGKMERRLTGHQGEVRHIAYSPDGTKLLSGSSDATARIWYDGEDQAKYVLRGHSRRITAIAFDTSGDRIATASFDGGVQLWDLTGDQEIGLDSEPVGWSLYGWLDPDVEAPMLRAQSFRPESGERTAIPERGMIVIAEATMNIRDSVSLGENGKWDQGTPIGRLQEGDRVKVLEVSELDPKSDPPGVWIQFSRTSSD
ncbi:ribosome assembly protein RRB1 [Haloferula helveola]|uniref:Ribosome assembly protein RRB1 n=2 Tax=Haloferula helveola TaxID=490095 RepID=A0ABM7RCS5_9BACT|nr:ribosome assembly protein RRB1 [Haloferula helveola]